MLNPHILKECEEWKKKWTLLKEVENSCKNLKVETAPVKTK